MPALCNVIGAIVTPNHAPLGGATVAFHRIPAVLQPSRDGLSTIAPKPVTAKANAAGEISVFIEPGAYEMTVTGADGGRFPGFGVAVPNAATANLADIQALVPPAPVYVDEIRASVAATAGAAGAAAQAAQRAEQAAAAMPDPATIVSVTGMRVVDGMLILDLSDGSSLQATLPAGGGGGPVDPVTVAPVLSGGSLEVVLNA